MSFQAGHEGGRTVLTRLANRSERGGLSELVTGAQTVEALSDRPSWSYGSAGRPIFEQLGYACRGRAPERRSPAVTYGRELRSDQAEKRVEALPKLIVRVRFPSSAPKNYP